MLSWLKPDPNKQLKKKIAALLLQARDTMRSGDVIAAAELYAKADALQQELDRVLEDQG